MNFFSGLSSPIGDFRVIFVFFFCVSVPPPAPYKSVTLPGPLTAVLGVGPKRAKFKYYLIFGLLRNFEKNFSEKYQIVEFLVLKALLSKYLDGVAWLEAPTL